MARYFTYRNQVKLGPGETLGFTKGRGYYARPARVPSPTPQAQSTGFDFSQLIGSLSEGPPPYQGLNDEDIDRRAAERANNIIAPQLGGLSRQRDRLRFNYDVGSNKIQGLSEGFLKILTGGKTGDEAAAFSKEQFGGSYLPAMATQQGQQMLTALTMDWGDKDWELAEKAVQLMEQEPAMRDAFRDDILSEEWKREDRYNENADRDFDKRFKLVSLILDREKEEWGRGFEERKFGEQMQQSAAALGLDAAKFATSTSQADQRIQNERARIELQTLRDSRNWQATLRRLGIQEENLSIAAAKLELQRRKKSGKGGFTAKQRSDLRGIAETIAEDAYRGNKEDEDSYFADPVGYQVAIREMLRNGVPLVFAQQALNRYYKKGQRGRPKLSLQQRQARAKKNRKK